MKKKTSKKHKEGKKKQKRSKRAGYFKGPKNKKYE